MYTVKFTKNAEKQKKLLKQAGLDDKAKRLLSVLAEDPFRNPPPYEKLVGVLDGCYSRRINYQHRLVYRVVEDSNLVIVHAMWTHYDSFKR